MDGGVNDLEGTVADLVGGLLLPLLLLSKGGIADLETPERKVGEDVEVGLGERISSADFTSGGSATLCTMLTDRQSAAGIMRYSLGAGGRQQPGQPGLLRPARVAGGSVLAHLQYPQPLNVSTSAFFKYKKSARGCNPRFRQTSLT